MEFLILFNYLLWNFKEFFTSTLVAVYVVVTCILLIVQGTSAGTTVVFVALDGDSTH